MMGGGPDLDKKFVNKVYRQIRDGATTIHAVTDLLGSPTYTHDFARGLLRVAGSGRYGTYNLVVRRHRRAGTTSPRVRRLLGLEDEVAVVPVTSDFFADDLLRQPAGLRAAGQLTAAGAGLDPMPHWRDALAVYSEVFQG